ncbi:MAG: hypothetical protein JW778_01400 [Candidatus Altiarchaeota archaeon]|nr:hypothetical protein [Candidatus Altiarchaeota archaeon]
MNTYKEIKRLMGERNKIEKTMQLIGQHPGEGRNIADTTIACTRAMMDIEAQIMNVIK